MSYKKKSNRRSILTLVILLAGLAAALFLAKQVQIFVQKASEGPVLTLTGVLTQEVVEGNPKTNTKTEIKYYLILSNGVKYPIDSSLVGDTKVGSTVTMQGISVSGQLSISSVQKTGSYTITPRAAVTGTRKVAVVLVNFNNKNLTSPTKSAVQSLMTGSFKSFYSTSSFGKFNINETNSDVYGPYTIDSAYACSTQTYSNIYQRAITAADPSINFSNYSYDLGNGMKGAYIMFVFPSDSNCSLNGFANSNFVTTGEGAFTFQMSYIPSNVFGLRTVAHEFGHNLGLKHAAASDCGNSKYPGTCIDYEYGDPWDMMGAWNYDLSPQVPDTARDFSASRKEELGWFANSNVVEVTGGASTYSLYPVEYTTTHAQVLKIKKNADANDSDYYYIENRFPKSGNVDAGIEASAANGILFRLKSAAGYSYNSSLYDMTPNSKSGVTADFKDAGMGVGSDNSLALPGGPNNKGIVVVLTSKDPSTGVATVYVSVGGTATPPPFDTARCWDMSGISKGSMYWSDPCRGVFSLYVVPTRANGFLTCTKSVDETPRIYNLKFSSSELTQYNEWVSAGKPDTQCSPYPAMRGPGILQ